jgi:hypothetical protein
MTSAFKIDASRGGKDYTVSSQWHRRPADQRFLSLDDLSAAVIARSENSTEVTLDASRLRVAGDEMDMTRLTVILPDGSTTHPTHWSFGQLAQFGKIGRATEVMRSQPAWLAGLNLQWGLQTEQRELPIKLYTEQGSSKILRAATGPDYGRIFDAHVVKAVQDIAGNGTGDTRWKVPGAIDWSTGMYNPFVDITTETTTLYASDRDCFIFLVDDTHPFEIGKLPDGSPDLVFRGVYIQNSETGARSFKLATFWLRGPCQNRILHGVENFKELTIYHSKYGRDRFVREAAPALLAYANSSPTKLLASVQAAKAVTVARDDDERRKFLTADAMGFSLRRANEMLNAHQREEGRPADTAWDMVNAITAVARTIPHQDERLSLEVNASRLLDRVSRNV